VVGHILEGAWFMVLRKPVGGFSVVSYNRTYTKGGERWTEEEARTKATRTPRGRRRNSFLLPASALTAVPHAPFLYKRDHTADNDAELQTRQHNSHTSNENVTVCSALRPGNQSPLPPSSRLAVAMYSANANVHTYICMSVPAAAASA